MAHYQGGGQQQQLDRFDRLCLSVKNLTIKCYWSAYKKYRDMFGPPLTNWEKYKVRQFLTKPGWYPQYKVSQRNAQRRRRWNRFMERLRVREREMAAREAAQRQALARRAQPQNVWVNVPGAAPQGPAGVQIQMLVPGGQPQPAVPGAGGVPQANPQGGVPQANPHGVPQANNPGQ